MTVVLYRVDDRLIHGQVVVGWGEPLAAGFIALVDDEVRASDWEQTLYRMGVPDAMEVIFASVGEAVELADAWERDRRRGIVLARSIEIMQQLIERGAPIERLNIGGLHHNASRTQRLRYVYLSDEEAQALRDIADHGVKVVAQDVPMARAVPLREFAS